jgi:hypothetical protein
MAPASIGCPCAIRLAAAKKSRWHSTSARATTSGIGPWMTAAAPALWTKRTARAFT